MPLMDLPTCAGSDAWRQRRFTQADSLLSLNETVQED